MKKGNIGLLILIIFISVFLCGYFLQSNPFYKFDVKRDEFWSGVSFDSKDTYNELSADSYIISFDSKVSLKKIYNAIKNYRFQILANSNEKVFLIEIPNPIDFEEKNKDIIKYFSKDNPSQYSISLNNIENTENNQIYNFNFDELSEYKNSPEIIIAVLDSGVNRNHVALQNSNILDGYDAVTQQYGVSNDSLGHGTSVIGMLCASKNNTTQVVGLLDNSTILPINVTDINGDISSSSFIRAIYYAVDSGAKIINMSFCGSEFNEAEQDAINYAFEKGCILIASTGNFQDGVEYQNIATFPSCYKHVVGVSSINKDGALSKFSFFNDNVDIAALGEGINVISGVTDKATYIADGTSFSAPYITALSSIILSNLDGDFSINSDEMEVLLRRNALEISNVRCVSVANTFLDRNRPIVCGIEDEKTYFGNVVITFNHGNAFLDGVQISSGTKVNYNGNHFLVINDNEYLMNYKFITDNLPLEFECPDGNVFYDSMGITFERGTATLNGEPYYSGKVIDKSGYYRFVLTGPYGNKVEKSFTLYLDVPKVFGLHNHKTYDSDVIFKVTGNGKAYLNNVEIELEKEIICSENQDYILVLSNYDGSKKSEVFFTIQKPEIESYYLGLSDCEFIIDEQFSTSYIYSDSFDGIRIFSNNNFTDIRKIISTEGKVKELLICGDYIYCLTENKLFVISRSNTSIVNEFIIESSNKIVTDGIYVYLLASNVLYVVDNGEIALKEFKTFESSFESVLYHSANNSLILFNNGSTDAFVLTLSNQSISSITFDSVINYLISDGNKLYSNNVVYNSDYSIHSYLKDFDPKIFINGCLLSQEHIFNVDKSSFIGVFVTNIISMFETDNYYYVLDDKGFISVYPIVESIEKSLYASEYIENDPFYVVSENTFDSTVKLNNNIFIKQWIISNADNSIYFISENSNSLFILDNDFKSCSKINLKDTPEYIIQHDGYIVVFFSSLKEVFVISGENKFYHSISFELDIDMIVGESDLFILSDGSIYKLIDYNVELFFDRNDILSIGYLDSLNCIVSLTKDGKLIKIDKSSGEIVAEITSVVTDSTILCKDKYFIVGNSLYEGESFSYVASFDNKVLDYKENVILLNNGIWTIPNNKFTSLGLEVLLSVYENNTIYSYTSNNEIIKYINDFGILAGDLPELIIEGQIIDDYYFGDVKVYFDFGIGYIDGHLFNSGDIIKSGGEHRITILLPYGQTVDRIIRIVTPIESLEILGVSEIKVNGSAKLEYIINPHGAIEEDIIFSSISNNVIVSEDGVVYGLKEGVAEIVCSTQDGRVSSTHVITVKPFELVIANNRFEIDSTNKYLTDVPCYMRASELLRFIKYNNGSARIVDSNNNIVEKHGYLSTGMWIEILNLKNEIILRYQISLNGDINGDGYILVDDYLLIGKHVFKIEQLDGYRLEAADVTSDGKVTISDLLMVSNHLLNKNRLYSFKEEYSLDKNTKISFNDINAPLAGENYNLLINFNKANISAVRGKIKTNRSVLSFVGIKSLESGWKAEFHDDGLYINFLIYNESFKTNDSMDNLSFVLEFLVSEDCNIDEEIFIDLIDVETENGMIGNKSHTITVKEGQDDTLLSDLILNNGDVDISFKNTVLKYSLTVPYNIEKIDIQYVLSNPEATILINNPILNVGNNLISLTISKDDIATVYEIYVFRQSEEELSSEARAKDISLTVGELSPKFNSEVFEYIITLDKDTEVGFVISMLNNKATYSIIEEDFGYTIRCTAENGDIVEYKFEKNVIYDFSSVEQISPDDKYWPIVIVLIIFALAGIGSTFILINRNKKV